MILVFTILKLESRKSLLTPKTADNGDGFAEFDKFIAAAKETKDLVEHMKIMKLEASTDEDDFEYEIDDDFPRSSFDEHGNETFFGPNEN